MEQEKLTYQKDAWQDIWKRQNLLTHIVNGGRTIYNWFFRSYLKKYITPKTRFLEVGCGTASLSLSLSNTMQELVGIDNAESALVLSRKNAHALNIHNATFTLEDCLNLPYTDEFDIVWSQGLLEHFEDPVRVAREHYKATRPGGIALLSVPYRYSYHMLWYLVTRPRVLRPLWPWTEQIFYTKQQLLMIGKEITPRARVHFLQPFPLGIIILELPK